MNETSSTTGGTSSAPQRPSRIPQIAKQQRKAEPTVFAAFLKNDAKVLTAQCPIPDDLAFVGARRKLLQMTLSVT
jgi:hypothetical protein